MVIPMKKGIEIKAVETGKTSFVDAMTSKAEAYNVTCQNCDNEFVIHSLWINGIRCRGCSYKLSAYDVSVRPLKPQVYIENGWNESDQDSSNFG